MIRGFWARPLAALVVACSVLAAACTPVVNPATGKTEYTMLTPADEARLGREEHPKVLAEYGGAYQDQRAQAYVNTVGQRMKNVSELKSESFTFTVLDSDIVNAFALPGGYVYISRGLLALADNEAELAGVLGHEVGHVNARHTAQRYDRAQTAQWGTAAATILGGILFGDAGAQLGQQAGGLGGTYYVQSYSREQEFAADELGIRYLTRAGYDPQAMASFLAKLDADSRLRARLAGKDAPEADWTSSHPSAPDRVSRARAEAGKGGKLDRDTFLAAINGITYGDSPAQGIIRGRTFIHPELDIRFEVPAGFKLANTPQAVQATSSDGRGIIFDMARSRSSGDPAAYLRSEWLGKAEPAQLRETTINGRRAATAFAQVTISNRPAVARLAAIEGGNGTVYRFVMANPGNQMSSASAAAFDQMVASFGRPSAAERAAAQPLRIDVHTVRAGDTVASLAARMPIDNARDWFLLLNGMEDRALRPGEKVKLVLGSGSA